MKFWQRLVILCSSAFLMLTVVYFYSDGQIRSHVTRARLRESHLWPIVSESFALDLDDATCRFKSTATSHPNISTYDLYQQTNFNVNPDGSYEMPSPPPDFPDKSDRDLEPLTVVVVPHSHQDPGWLKTVDEYYIDQTKHILTNMVNKLTEYPNMTFVMAETVFFNMWWNELEDAVKVHVRRLVRRGQLEVVLGGWVMPDEASTHYTSVVDQLVEGHQWLWENLGVKPQNSWSIDPFGYSGTMPYLWKKAGMDNMVIQRVHQSIKGSLIARKSLEFTWRQAWDSKGTTDIQCHVMPYMLYSIKFTCGPNKYVCLLFDFRNIPNEYSESRSKTITEENIEKQAKYLYEQYRKKSFLYKYNTILVPLGDDFRYDYEVEWDQQYKNYAALMNYMNNKKEWKITVKFGTLKEYFKLMRKQKSSLTSGGRDGDLPVLSGDFFPYSDQNSEYWSGYFTTRPFDKKFSRDVQQHIHAADILNTLAFAYFKKWKLHNQDRFFKYSSFLQKARRSHGLFLHHDAITGTAKSYVVVDYETRLLHAYNDTQHVMAMAIQALLSKGKVESPLVFKPETVRPVYYEQPQKQLIRVKEEGTVVVFFNPMAQHRQEVVRVITDTDHIVVKNDRNRIIPYQINPVWEDKTMVSGASFEIVFIVEISPFGIAPYTLLRVDFLDWNQVYPAKISMFNTPELIVPPGASFYQTRPKENNVEPFVIENDNYTLSFDPKTGSLKHVVNRQTHNKTDINLEILAYHSQGSGAYLFYPAGEAKSIFYDSIPVIRVIEGPIMSQVQVIFFPVLVHTVTVYNHPPLQAAGIYISNNLNMLAFREKEIIMRMKTSINNKDSSYFTDQNGFQLIKRKTNNNLRVEANYYPMTSMGVVEDDLRRLTLHSGQSHGVAGLKPGWFEVMLDRQTIYDDNRGLSESVEDIKPVTSDFVLMLEDRQQANRQKHFHFALPSMLSVSVGDFLQTPLVVFFSQVETDVFHHTFTPLSSALPCDTTVTSFRSLATANLVYNGTSLILHRRGYDCDFPVKGIQCAASDQSISLGSLLKDFPPRAIRETTLTHLYEKGLVELLSPLNISPMELAAYHIQW